MQIALIAAMAENRVIGHNNQLPWRISADLKHFKSLTMGKPIIMGRKTWQSIGRPLPGRTNIVITRDSSFQAAGCEVVHSLEQALQAAAGHQQVMIIGGANLYQQTLARADLLYLTLVRAEVQGDAFFPELEEGEWRELERESHSADENNEYDYDFITLQRIHV